MTLPPALNDREQRKFEEINNEVHVRTTNPSVFDDGGTYKTRTTAEGTFTDTGLEVGGTITTMNVTDTATLLPASARTDRKTMSVYNLSTTDSFYWGFHSGVEANQNLGTDAGIKVEPGNIINFDFAGSVNIYAIAESGITVKIQVIEGA